MLYSFGYFNDMQKSIINVDLSGLIDKKILVTGATGLIGSAIVDILLYLNEKHLYGIRIYAAIRNIEKAKARFSQSWDSNSLNFVYYDANKKIDFKIIPDYIIHAASNAHPQAFGLEPVETMTANSRGVYNILEYAFLHKVKRVLYISSSEIYGKKPLSSLYCETDYGYIDLLSSRSCYPISKRAAETMCVSFIKEYGCDVVIVRPGHIYGPTQTKEDSRASAQFLREASDNKNIIIKSAGMQLRSYCHCLDCATAIFTVLLRGEAGKAYNISNHNSIATIRQFAEACSAYTGRQIQFEMPSSEELSNYNKMECSALDSKLLEELGWEGVWNLYDGITESIDRIREDIRENMIKDNIT